MANISKELMHKCTSSVIKSVIDPKLVSFKRVELGGGSDTRFFGIKDSKGNDMFWVVLLDESSGFGRGYVNIIKKGSDPTKKQEAMVNAWKKVRKPLQSKKAGVVLVDPDLPNNENPFPLTAKLVTEDKTSASKTPLGSLIDAVYNAFITVKSDALTFEPMTATNPDYDHQLEIALPHKTVWEYIYPSSGRESPTGDTPDLLKVLAADLKDSCFIVRLTGVSVKNGTDDEGNDRSIVKVCMKVHYIVEMPNLGAFIKVKKAAPEDNFSGASFDSFTNGMSGLDFYKELVDGKVSDLSISTPKKEKKDKGGKKAIAAEGVEDAAAKTKKSRPKKSKDDEESPLKKSKNSMTGISPATFEELKKLADDKLTAEMDKLIDEAPAPAEEEEEDGEVVVDDDGEEVTVVEETQREELDPVLKARKKSRLGVV
jgi:hypothetical protein